MANPGDLLQLTAYDKTLTRLGEIAGIRSGEFHPTLNAAGTGTFSLDADDPVNAWLRTPGCRVVVNYRGRQELSGPVREQDLGLALTDRTSYVIEDDWRVLANTRAWVVPVAAYGSQGQLEAQSLSDDAQAISTVSHAAGTNAGYGAFVFSAPTTMTAEAAIKELIRQNLVARLGAAWSAARGGIPNPHTIAADQGRGGIPGPAGKLPTPRFESLADNLSTLLQWSGLRVTVAQSTSSRTVVVDVSVPPTYGATLTIDSGVLVDGQASLKGPTATRVVVGGSGDTTARAWSGVASTSLEQLYGDVIEVLKEASNVPMNWATTVPTAQQVEKYFPLQTANAAADVAAFRAAFTQAGNAGLTEGAPVSGLGVTLAETDSFHYGGPDGISLGTWLPIQAAAATYTRDGQLLSPPVVLVQQVTQANIVLDASAGVTAETVVGQRTDDPDLELARALGDVQRALQLRASRR